MGLTGSGKTKTMVSMVNEAIQNESGDVVCVERGKTLTYDIPRRVRLVSTEEFGINTNSLFQGFLTGLHAANFDITHVFVDCFYKILDDNSNEAVEALQLMVDMKDDGYFTPNHPGTDFAAGKAVMYNDATPFIFENMKSANFEIKMALQPVLKDGVAPYTSMGLYCYAVTSESKNAQAAYDFLEFLCTDVDYQIDYCKPYYFIPSLKEAVASSYFKTEDWKIVLEQLSHSKATPGIENWQEMDMFIYEAIQSALDGRTSAKVALDTAKNNIDALIKK
jgi:ABC-type glycerol-3-phosphate transport system substrate-binding protein